MRSLITSIMLLGGVLALFSIEWYWLVLALVYTTVVLLLKNNMEKK